MCKFLCLYWKSFDGETEHQPLGSITPTFNEQLFLKQTPKRHWRCYFCFALLGSARVKATRKHVGEINPTYLFSDNLTSGATLVEDPKGGVVLVGGTVNNESGESVSNNIYRLSRCQFYQHFTSAYFVKSTLHLFANYNLALQLFGARILAQKLIVKC